MVKYQTNINDETLKKAIEVSLKMKSNVRRRKIAAVIITFAGLLLAFPGAVACLGKITGSDMVTLLLGIAIMIFGLNQKSFQRAVIKKNSKQTDPVFRSGTIEYIFDSDGIRIQSHLGNGMYHWDGFKEYGTLDECLYIIRRDDKVIIVNQNELSEGELQELRQLLAQNLDAKK